MDVNVSIQILKQAASAKQQEINQLQSELRQINLTIQQLTVMPYAAVVNNDIAIDSKPQKKARRKRGQPGTTVLDKVAETIKKANRFLHKTEIQALSGIEDVTATISLAKKRGDHDITSFQPGKSRNQTVWGFGAWLDSNGKPKPENMYNVEYVESRK